MARPRTQRGVVITFDEGEGLGTLEVAGSQVTFHCTAITDGSRDISVGAEVVAEIAPGPSGTIEAVQVTPT